MTNFKHATKLDGKSFGCEVLQVPADKLDSFYRDNEPLFSPSGKRMFFRAMGIPEDFFKKQTDDLQQGMLVAQKHRVSGKATHLNVLVSGDDTHGHKIVYAAPENKDLGWQDPEDVMEISQENGWIVRRTDFSTGIQQYMSPLHKDASRDKYQPAIFLDVPLLYQGKFNMNLAVWKQVCTNGAVNIVESSGIKIPMKGFNRGFFGAFVKGIRGVNESLRAQYDAYFEQLQKTKITVTDARDFLKVFSENTKAPKTLVDKATRHLDLVAGKQEVPANSPQVVSTLYDVFDTLTFYVQQLPSVTSQARSEGLIYDFFSKHPTGEVRLPRAKKDVLKEVFLRAGSESTAAVA